MCSDQSQTEQKLKVRICIGDSCHLQGAEEVVKSFQQKIEAQNTEGRQVELKGCFCMNKCHVDRVAVEVDGEKFSLESQTADEFFATQVTAKE